MQLHLIRHGKTNQASKTGRDFDRELLGRGIQQSQDLGKVISGGLNLNILCSSSQRTRETFENLCKTGTFSSAVYMDNLYLCSQNDLLEIIWKTNDRRDLMIIGHNFGISDLAGYFLDEDVEMRTGEYLLLEFPFDHWKEVSRATATLVHRYRSGN